MTNKMTDDEMQRMPWTKYLMTNEELREWVASRGEAGRAIDIETCELGSWAAYDADPYGVDPKLSEEMQQVGTNRFVRSSESGGWVWEKALYDRIAGIEAALSSFERAVLALRRLPSSEQRAEALYQAYVRERCEIHEQNEAEARAAGYPNLISMQAEGEFDNRSSVTE